MAKLTVTMELMRRAVPQRTAPTTSSNAPTVSASPSPSCATRTRTVPMVLMRLPVPPPPAVPTPSSVTTLCVYRVSGPATATPIVPTVQTSGPRTVAGGTPNRQQSHVGHMNSTVGVGSVSIGVGAVMEARTVRIIQMKPTAVGPLASQMSFSVTMAPVSMVAVSVTASLTARI